MAKEKPILYLALGIAVTLAVIGLIVMFKGGAAPGRATEEMFAPMGGDLVPSQTPRFTIAPQPDDMPLPSGYGPKATISTVGGTQPGTPSTTSFLSDIAVAIDTFNLQNAKSGTYTFFVQPNGKPNNLYVITVPLKDAQYLAIRQWIGASQSQQRITSILFYNRVPTDTLDGLRINDQSFKTSIASAVKRLNAGGTYATSSDKQSARVDTDMTPPIYCDLKGAVDSILADLQAIIDMCK